MKKSCFSMSEFANIDNSEYSYPTAFENVKKLSDIYRRNIYSNETYVPLDVINQIKKDIESNVSWSPKLERFGANETNVESVVAGVCYSNVVAGIAKDVLELASAFYGRSLIFHRYMLLNKFCHGASLHVHTDSEEISHDMIYPLRNYATEQASGIDEISGLIYINDDYDGGEIYFPDTDVLIKPKPGQLVMFPSGHQYRHGVTEIKNGERYTFSFWLTTPKLDAIRKNHIGKQASVAIGDTRNEYFLYGN